MAEFISVSDLARKLNCRPRDISDAFYDRVLNDSACPVVGRRRLIPMDYVPTIRKVLRSRGALKCESVLA